MYIKNFMYTDVSQRGSNLYISGYNLVTNQKEIVKTNSIPNLSLYHANANAKKVKFSYPNGVPVVESKFKSIYDYKEYISDYKNVHGMEIYGDYNLPMKWINENYAGKVPFEINRINIGVIDIENLIIEGLKINQSIKVAGGKVTAVTLYTSKSDKYYVFADSEDFDRSLFEKDKDFDKIEFRISEDEIEMLLDLATVMCIEEKIDVITGWNSRSYDLAYLFNRIERLAEERRSEYPSLSANILSPIKSAYKTKKDEVVLGGIQILDYMELYFKYVYKKLASYKLNFVGNYEVGTEKIDYDGSLNELYEKDYGKYLYYNFHDVRIVKMMEDKLNFILLQIQISYEAKQNFDDTFSPVRTWESLVYSECVKRNLVLEPKKHHQKVDYPGAYVEKPTPGFRKDVVSFDLNSLYPHLEMGDIISPETILSDSYLFERFGDIEAFQVIMQLKENVKYSHDIIEHDKIIDMLINRELDLSFLANTDVCLSASLEFFRKDPNAIMPMFMDKFYTERGMYKKLAKKFKLELETLVKGSPEFIKCAAEGKKNDLMQLAYKILINSQYGALGNVWFRFYDIRLAKAITIAGRLAIKSIMKTMNDELNNMLNVIENKELTFNLTLNGVVHEVRASDDITINRDDEVIEVQIKDLCFTDEIIAL